MTENRDRIIKKAIGNKIKTYRKLILGVSRNEFIENVTDKYASIENIETGRSFPDIEFMIRLSNKYHMPIYNFIETGYVYTDISELSSYLQGFCDKDKYKILQTLNIEKYHCLRKQSIELFVDTDGRDNYPVNMGKLIHNERIKRNILCDVLAEKIGISSKTLRNIEHGNSIMSMGTMYRLCCELRLPMDYLVVDRLDDITSAVEYLIYNIFYDTDMYERKFLVNYITLYKEFYEKNRRF